MAGYTINEVEDPAVVLAIPEAADVPYIEAAIRKSYEGIEHDYVSMESDEMPPWLARRGSLMQELLGQINAQID